MRPPLELLFPGTRVPAAGSAPVRLRRAARKLGAQQTSNRSQGMWALQILGLLNVWCDEGV